MLIVCTCGATNRVPTLPKARIRCGQCKHKFTPLELSKCRPEPPPERVAPSMSESDGDFELEAEEDACTICNEKIDENNDCKCTRDQEDDDE